jgi:predicted esterase
MSSPSTVTRQGNFRCLEYHPAHTPSAAVIWLHGIGERGSDISLVAKYGLPAELSKGSLLTNARVVCPQLEADGEWPAARLLALLSEIQSEVGPTMLVGYSLGGLGVCEFLRLCGPVAAAYVAIAGRPREHVSGNMAGARFLALSGELDPRPGMQEYVRSVNAGGGSAVEVILPKQGHYIPEVALRNPSFLDLAASAGVRFEFREEP